jgi:hypothetical protein
MPEPQPQLSTTIINTNTNTYTNEHQYNTIWDECIYLKNPIPVRMIVLLTPSDSIVFDSIAKLTARAYSLTLQKKDNQPHTYQKYIDR